MRFVSPFAFFAAVAQAAPHLETFLPHGLPAGSPHMVAFRDAHHRIVLRCGEDESAANVIPPLGIASPWSFYCAGGAGVDCALHLQKVLVAAAETTAAGLVPSLFQLAGDHARWNSCKSKHSGAWMLAMPTESATSLPDEAYRIAARLRLGLPPAERLPEKCLCNKVMAHDPVHFLSCRRITRSAINRRHNMVVQALATWIRRAGGSATVEPKNLSFEDGKRPICKWIWARSIFWWTSRCGILQLLLMFALVNMRLVWLSGLNALSWLAISRWRESICQLWFHSRLSPMGPLAMSFIKQIANHARFSSNFYSAGALFSSLVQSISIAVHRGNTDAIAQGLRLSLPSRPQSFRSEGRRRQPSANH
jgi:hypothetical protein